MHNRRSLILALALIAALFGAAADAAQQVTLKWKFEEGQDLVFRMTMTNETEMPNGMGVAVVENIITSRWQVQEVNAAGDATVYVSTDRVRMSMQGPMGNMEMDSASEEPATDPVGKIVSALAGTGYTVVFDAAGKPKEIRGLEEMRARLTEGSPQTSNPMFAQLLEQTASEDGIKNMLQQGFAAFPDHAVGPGDSWTANFDMTLPMMGIMSNTTVMTLDRIEERDGSRIAVIKTTGTMEMIMDEGADNPLAGMMELGAMDSVGTTEWDVDRGRFAGMTSTTTMEMNMTAGGQAMSIMTIMNMKMELIEEG